MKKVLIIDSPESIEIPGKSILENRGYEFSYIHDEILLQQMVFDHTLFGIGLSFEFNKQEVVSLIRNLKSLLGFSPLIVFLKEDDELHTVLALEAGADEVISPDMSSRVSQARVLKAFDLYHNLRITLSGKDDSLEESIHIGDFKIHPKESKCLKKDLEIHLTPREVHFLCYLFKHRNRIVSREEIWASLQRTFGNISPNKRLIDVAIYKLRKKLDLNSTSAFNILTVFDKGYYMKVRKDLLPPQTDL
ncbi:MAG TPA: response regulator transcription factor [Planococcus sp. (in: firmicutes)]|nr:response regulator transcription factor [Planococcus sp. (in: firmicutes)]